VNFPIAHYIVSFLLFAGLMWKTRPRTRPPKPRSSLLRFHGWCIAQASKHDRPGYPWLAAVFDWVGGRAADLYLWTERRRFR
jgi:hypothetical protein